MMNQKKKYQKGDGFDAWWEERNLPQKILVGSGFGVLGIGFLGSVGLLVMVLWNNVMPDIFGLKKVKYSQACSLLALCAILFNSMHFQNDNNRINRKRRQQFRNYMQENQAQEEE